MLESFNLHNDKAKLFLTNCKNNVFRKIINEAFLFLYETNFFFTI